MPFREHSTFTALICGDWANTTDLDLEDPGTSRVQSLVSTVRNHPANPKQIDPHILRVECPAAVVSQPERTSMFIGLNQAILSKTWFVYVDGHSDCAGIPVLHPDHTGDQYDLQHEMIMGGAQRFVNMLSAFSEHPVKGIFSYVQFNHRKLESVKKIVTMESTIAFPHGLTMAHHPSGNYDPGSPW